MKRSVRNIPAALSLILLAAHFLRMQNLFFVALSLCLAPFLFTKRSRLAQAIRIYLVLGAVLWVHTLFMIISERKALGLPFAAAAMILGAVTIFTLASALLAAPEKSAPAEHTPA